MKQTQQQSEINRLRSELIHTRTQVGDLQEELKEKTNLYLNAISDRNKFKERLNNAKESINRVDNIVESKVNAVLEKERTEFYKAKEENQLLKQRIEMMDQEKEQMAEREKALMDKVQGLTQDLAFYARNIDARESMKRIEALRDEKDQKERMIIKLTQDLNKLSNEAEDFIAENTVLRKMANVPKNYGINREQVKLHDKEKIDDFKKMIRVLQDDNYRLEEERAKLKHMLKQQSMLYKQEPSQRYKGLSQEQIFKVDQYVLKLLSGETEEPADFYKLKKENQNLKAQLEALNSKGFDFVRAQLEQFFKEKGFGDSNKLFEKLLNGNEELAKLLQKILTQGISASDGTHQPTNLSNQYGSGKFRPPLPHQGFDGDISQGFSYKFDTHLEVVDKNGKPGLGETNRYDVACLQLQLCECLELIKRKDENLNQQQNEIDSLYKRVRDYLLVQDQLYKDFVSMEKDHNGKKTKLELDLRNVRDALVEEQMKVKHMEGLVSTLQKGDKQTIEHRLIELTKINSILDINLLRLTRKYQTLEEQEQMLRREYHNKEADLAEKDRFIQDRLNKLKEWKARAIQQLKFLFQKLRFAVPLSEYQSVEGELDIYKQKNADFIDRNAKMAQRLSKLQTQVRDNMEAQEKLRNLQEIKDETENELEVVRKRLENADPNFKWEMAIFNKIVAVLKRVRVSPQQAFEEFDVNKDGRLTRQEFLRALEILKISDLSGQEIDILMSSLDVDSDGHVNYKEFVHKLSRHGVRSRTTEEQIIYLIIEALQRSRVKSLSDAFELIDKEGRGIISRDDFKDIFRNLNVKIDPNDIEKFIDQFWKDKVGGIDYQQFLRIFNRYQIKLEESDNAKKRGATVKIPDSIIRLKKRIFVEMNNAFTKAGKTLKSLFSKIDVDQSNQIELDEFRAMFEKMGLKLTPIESEQIFNSIDFDYSGKISFPELASDFEHCVQTDIDILLREEKEKAAEATKSDGRAQMASREQESKINEDILRGMPKMSAQNMESQYQTKIAILESREKQLARKYETSMRILRHSESAKTDIQDGYDQLEKKWNEMTEQYHIQKEKIRELEEELRHSIRKTEAEKIKYFNESLKTELTETKAAMISYKNMTEVIADQAKGLKLQMERKKDEYENLLNINRELSSQSIDQQRLGKLYYIVMLSRWQEAAVNKKYDMILTENKELRKELINTEQLYQNKEYDHHECENTLQDRQLQIEKLKQILASTKGFFLTLEKAEELNSIIQNVSDEKTELEEHYFKLRAEFLSTQFRMDEAVSKADHANELLEVLQRSKQTELSDRLIELSEKLQKIRLNELRSSRECGEMKEKNNYISRLLKTNIDQIKKLEEQVSEYESKMHKKEEEFRKADNDRMKRFFNARFDDIPGALQGNSRGGGGGFEQNYFEKKPSHTYSEHKSQSFSPESHQRSSGKDTEGHGSALDKIHQKGIGLGSQQQSREGDVRVMEGQVKRLKEELKNAVEQIKAKDSIINRFKEWQIADKYLSQDEQLRDAIDQNRMRAQGVHEQESKEMAEAAYTTIKTLQEMLDQKNQQLRSKEEIIVKYTKQMSVQREQDAIEISRLQQQLSLTAGTTLSKLQEIVVRQDAHSAVGGPNYSHKYDRLTREELQKTLDEKDHTIQELKANIAGLAEEKHYLHSKKQELADQMGDLEFELNQQKQQNEVKANRKELERLRKELKEKDQKNQSLKLCIDELSQRMTEYEIQKSHSTEDQKMAKIQEHSKFGEKNKTIDELKQKLRLMETQRNQRGEDLKALKVKEQERGDQEKKLTIERDDARKALLQTRENLDREMRQRQQIQIEVNQLRGTQQIGRDQHSSGPTFEQMLVRNKELENDILILQCQQKTVVVYNKETATFEYIGEPIFLNHDKELNDIEEIIDALTLWLQRNNRLTIRSIFESMDKQNFGELTESKFEQALNKIGVKLRQREKQILKELLDPRNIGYLKYRPLIRAISGVPQIEFMNKDIIKMGKLVEARDLSHDQFLMLIDPKKQESMNLPQFQESCKQMKSDNFSVSDQESEAIFKYITKSLRTTGVVLSISKLTEHVFKALKALLIEKMKDSILKSMKSLSDLFSKFDVNKDGFLTYGEMENLLLECQLAFKPNSLKLVFNILDEDHRLSKISYQILKFYISEAGSFQAQVSSLGRSLDYEPSLEGIQLSEETANEELNYCRQAARKILSAGQGNLPEILSKKDVYHEGIIAREDIQRVLEEQKIPELTVGELNLILKYTDKGHKGYISIQNFMDKLQELAIETKQDIMLRRFGNTIKHQGINLRAELQKFDNGKGYRLDKKTFERAMRQLSIALTDEEIELLFKSSEILEQKGYLDVKHFLNKVTLAQKSKPLPNFIAQQPKTAQAQSKIANGKQQPGGVFENWEAEKKYKKKLEALQQQIEESKKETQAVEKQAKHWQDVANKLEREKNSLQTRLVDFNAKPPKAAMYESLNQGQLEHMQGLKDQLFYLQEQNNKLEKTLQVEMKSELGKLSRDKDKLEDKLKHLQEENKRLEYQVQRLIGKPMDQLEIREEGELWREKRIQELEKELEDRDKNEKDSNDQLFKAEEKLLDLKFQKETFDLQYARLQKRITDLEQYKLASSKFSAVLKKQDDEEQRKIEEIQGVTMSLNPSSSQKGPQDTVKLRNRSTKSVLELEIVVEALKRVIEKQKTEMENLRQRVADQDKHKDKLKSEKQLRQKIDNLELEVHSHEMKEINLEGKDKTIKKILDSNKILREDLRREAERYQILENKYKDLLIKYNVLAKEHAKNVEKLFAMNTGGNIHNYENYLQQDPIKNSHDDEYSYLHNSQKKRSESNSKYNNSQQQQQQRSRGQSYERDFEDVY